MLLVEVEKLGALQIRMELDLVANGHHFCGFEDRREVLGEVVGDADGFREASCLELFHLQPGRLQPLLRFSEPRHVDEVPRK